MEFVTKMTRRDLFLTIHMNTDPEVANMLVKASRPNLTEKAVSMLSASTKNRMLEEVITHGDLSKLRDLMAPSRPHIVELIDWVVESESN